jgi:hypothetical protein
MIAVKQGGDHKKHCSRLLGSLGAWVSAAIGVGLGLVWTSAFETSDFEGYGGMLVFFALMP